MSFKEFKNKIAGLIERSGEETEVKFNNENGRYSAHCDNGVRFFASPKKLKITVVWGSGHQAQFV